jgi:hypothetical protein
MSRDRPRRPGLVAIACVAVAVAVVAMPALASGAGAQPSLGWSPATRIDGGEVGLRSVACPSTTECVTVDGSGQEATFDPAAPPETPAPVTIDPGGSPGAVACPSSTQCTAMDSGGDALTFDPTAPAAPMPLVLDAGTALSAVACPTATRCVAVGPSGEELTFDPQGSAAPTVGTLGGAQLRSVACAGADQCTAVDAGGTEWTFDPADPSTTTSAPVDSGLPAFDPAAIACPSAGQCTVAGSDGKIETFDPDADPVTPQQTTVSGTPRAISCPETTQCTAVADGDLAYTFDPTNLGTPAARSLPKGGGEGFPQSVACPSAHQCTSVDTDGPGVSVTWDPVAAAPEHALNGAQPPAAVACVSATECTSVDGAGEEIAYDPTVPTIEAPAVIDPSRSLTALTCPAGQTTCVALDGNGAEVTYDPLEPAGAAVHQLPVVAAGTGVSCPASDQCTLVDVKSVVETFDPTSGASAGAGEQFFDFGNSQLNMVSCPSTTQCTAIDADGDEFTWDPTDPAASPTGVPIDGGRVPTGLACPATSLCAAVDAEGNLVTFDPTQATPSPDTVALAGAPRLTAVACPSAGRCTALAQDETAYTFDPASPGTPVAVPIGSGSLGDTDALACASTTQCTATDSSAGEEVTFDPQATPTASVDTATGLASVACPVSTQCTTVDRSGNAITFDPANLGTPTAASVLPASTSGYLVSCPNATECVTLGGVETPSFSISEQAAEFDPTHPGAATPVQITPDIQGFRGLICTTTSLCVAVEINGKIATFDPADPGTATITPVTGAPFFTGLACPSAGVCAAVATGGKEVTFDPTDPTGATLATIDGSTALDAVACASASQCTALDGAGDQLTFDPADPGTPAPEAVGSKGPITCLTGDDCVAAGPRNTLLEGDPTSTGAWQSEAVPGGNAPLALGCPANATCVELDSVGNESTAARAAPPLEGLTVSPAGSGSGTVTSSPAGIDCGATCFAQFDQGQAVTLTASPATGSSFAGWSGRGCSGTGACQVTMSAAQSVSAEFTLSSTGGSGGSGGTDGSGGSGESAGPGTQTGSSAQTPPPKVAITSHPPEETAEQTAEFKFSGAAGGFYECSIDGGPWKGCSSGESFGPLQPGDHRLEVRETLDGLTGAAASYSWTVDLPTACVLKVARARVFAFTHQGKARLVIRYKAYKPARVTVSYSLQGTKGGLALGTASARFKTAGTFTANEKLGKAQAAKLAATTSMKVRFSIPGAPSNCTRYYTKRLTIPKKISGQTVWFQSDSVFGPQS